MDVFGIVFGLFGLVFVGTGLYFVWQALVGIARAVRSRNWMPADGTILSSTVEHDLSGASTSSNASYAAKIEYEYEVRGNRHTGTNIDFSRFRQMSPKAASRLARKYPVGKAITVYHHPWQPEKAVLEPGRIGPQISGLVVGGAVALFGTFFGIGGMWGTDAITDIVGDGPWNDPEFAWTYLLPIFPFLGLAVMIFGVYLAISSSKSKRWPTAPGHVTGSGIVRQSSSSSRSTGSGPITNNYTYKAEIVYKYDVEGETYVNNQVRMSDISSSNQRAAETTKARYPVGAEVTVYYDPNNTERSVLEPGGSGGAWLPILVGAGFVIISLIIMGFHAIVSR